MDGPRVINQPRRRGIDAFTAEAFRLGLTSRRVTTDDYFADYLLGD